MPNSLIKYVGRCRGPLKSTYCHTQTTTAVLLLTWLSVLTYPTIYYSSANPLSDSSDALDFSARETLSVRNSDEKRSLQQPASGGSSASGDLFQNRRPPPQSTVYTSWTDSNEQSYGRANNRPNSPAQSSNIPSRTFEVYKSVVPNSSVVETFVEGSGDGPIPASPSKVKFDDTEGEDDDDEEEDYDYKDTGSGQGNMHTNSKKTESEVESSNLIKKPTVLNELDPYNPFRPPPPALNASTTPPTIAITTYATPVTTTSGPETNMSPLMDLDAVESKAPDIKQPSNTNAIISTTPIPPANRPPQTTHNLPSREQTEMTSLTATATSPSIQLNSLNQMTTTVSPLANVVKHTFNATSSLRPNHSKNAESDYDYEEDAEDDESEDSSNFEDNEPLEEDIYSNKTLSINNTAKPTSEPSSPVLFNFTTPIPKPAIITSYETTPKPVSPITREPVRFTTIPQDQTWNNYLAVTTPNYSASSSSPDYNDDEDEDEDEEDEEPIEDELDEDEDDSIGGVNQSPVVGGVNSHSSSPNRSHPPSATTPKPLYSLNDRQQNYPPTIHQAITTPSASQTLQPAVFASSTRPPVTLSSAKSSTTPVSFPPTPPSTTTTTSSTTTSTSTVVPTSTAATSATIKYVQPSITTMTTSTPIPKLIWPTTVPTYSPTSGKTPPINFVTSGKGRNIPTIPSNTQNNYGIGTSLQEDDTGLTRQIYDKAVEVYKATSEAIHVAVETLWPSSFEVNSSTFEPLLTQPLIFMLALGAAVMGLVLTMMLVVYIITYQIQPKDDVSIY